MLFSCDFDVEGFVEFFLFNEDSFKGSFFCWLLLFLLFLFLEDECCEVLVEDWLENNEVSLLLVMFSLFESFLVLCCSFSFSIVFTLFETVSCSSRDVDKTSSLSTSTGFCPLFFLLLLYWIDVDGMLVNCCDSVGMSL